MYKVVSYYDSRGRCEIQDWLDDLNNRAAKGDKDSRIQLKDIMFCFRLFKENGTRMGKYCARVELTDCGNFDRVSIGYFSRLSLPIRRFCFTTIVKNPRRPRRRKSNRL